MLCVAGVVQADSVGFPRISIRSPWSHRLSKLAGAERLLSLSSGSPSWLNCCGSDPKIMGTCQLEPINGVLSLTRLDDAARRAIQ